MNNLSNIFSTREIAIFIWFLILLIFAIRTKEVRNSIVRVIKAFFNRKLFLAFCTLLIYILLVVFILSVIGFWDISLLKDTVFWTLFSGIVLFMNINKIENVNYFSSLIKDNIKVIVIWEFLFNFYTLSLIGELVLIPVVSLFSIMEVFAEHSSKQEENQKKVVTFCKNVLGLIGLGLIVYVVYKTITKYELLFSVSKGCKFVPEGDMDGTLLDRSHSPVDFPLIRYADVLLMLAECYNENGNQKAAVEMINKVRQRPSTNMPAINNGDPWMKATTKEEVFQRIVHERAVELACEGHRFGDLKRWGLCEEKLNYEYDDIVGQKLFARKFVARDYKFPIPKEEILRNPALGEQQNPGW